MGTPQALLTPVGRYVAGDLYVPNTKDYEGKPLVGKDGQPRVDFSVGIAIKKGTEQHWAQTAWGQTIYAAGAAGYPGGQANAPTFAWKVTDGDSTIPNKKGNKPCDKEGFPGHWVLFFSSGFAPKVCNADGSQQITEAGAVKRGYYIQVAGTVNDNAPSQSPGVYLNLQAVALAGYGPEIASGGVDVATVGFGGALPAGASSVPLAGGFNPAPAVPAGMAAMPGMPAAMPQMPAAMPVVPNPAALGMPMAPPAMPVAPPAGPRYTMLAPAGQFTREQYLAQGWTNETLVANGYMTIG